MSQRSTCPFAIATGIAWGRAVVGGAVALLGAIGSRCLSIFLAESFGMRQPFPMFGRFQGVDDDFAGQFEELYRVAYRAAYGILGNRAEAEDCSQEALARALVRWRRMHDYAPAWVARVSVNLALDRTRSTRRADRLAPPAPRAAATDGYDLAAAPP